MKGLVRLLSVLALFAAVAIAASAAPAAAPQEVEPPTPEAELSCPAPEAAVAQPPEPIWLGDGSCTPMPPLCTATGMQVEYCDCVAAGGSSGLCRCIWCLGESVETCKVTGPRP